MKRWIATTAALAAVTAGISPPANAQATADGPVEALERALVPHRGVKASSRWTMRYVWDKTPYVYLYKISAEFGRGRVVAADTTYRPGNKHAGAGSFRYVTFVGREYLQNKHADLPPGKTWVLEKGRRIRPSVQTMIRIDDPASLRAVLATTKVKRAAGTYDGTPTTLYEGSITIDELYRASPASFRIKPQPKESRAKVSWRIWFGKDLLPRRVWSSWRSPAIGGDNLDATNVSDHLLTGWGTRIRITPPPADQVAPYEDVD
ncbi:hypothetical protein [Herbidospora sp. RD11066]